MYLVFALIFEVIFAVESVKKRMFAKFTRVTRPTILFSKRGIVETLKAKKEYVPPVALFVGISALCFQVAVLYPWHAELSHQFATLEVRIRNSVIFY